MKKIKNSEFGTTAKLTRMEMKDVKGGVAQGNVCGVGECYYCTSSNGNSFASNDSSFMLQWGGFWIAAGYTVECGHYRIQVS